MKNDLPQDLSLAINSESYWEHRFAHDWATNFGREQSKFFSTLAINNLPTWFIEFVTANKLSLCDWGCAEGDGTNELTKFFKTTLVTGVDFSQEAVQRAQAHYPSCKFICADFLTSHQPSQCYDIVFSSNTLEHFKDPWSVFGKLSEKAGKFIILLLPFREINRHKEHFVTFDYHNISVSTDHWVLIHSTLIETQLEKPSYWNGEQLLVIYCHTEELKRLNLSLSDIAMDTYATFRMKNSLNEITEIKKVKNLLEMTTCERDVTIQELNKSLNEQNLLAAKLSAVYNSKSWRLTRPLRFAIRLCRDRLHTKELQHLKQELHRHYHQLPIPPKTKKLISWAYHQVLCKPVRIIFRLLTSTTKFKPPSIKPVAQNSLFPDYFVWGVIPWHLRHQRPQHLSIGLTKTGRRVFYISPSFIEKEQSGFAVEPLDSEGRLFEIRLHLNPSVSIYQSIPTIDTIKRLQASIGELLDWSDSNRLVSLVQHPFWCDVSAPIPSSHMVYDCMDHHEGFENTAPEMIALEQRLLEQADLTVTTSDFLDRTVGSLAHNRVIIRNGGEYEHFAHRPTTIYSDPKDRRIIGYYGAIAEWFDQGLVEATARRFPDCCILLIGADTAHVRSRLGAVANVTFIGEVPYNDLPYYLYSFDVCLLPFKIIPLTLATNPVKVYEYLSAGKPIVSVDLPEMAQFGELVRVAGCRDTFLAAIDEVLNCHESTEIIQMRKTFAKGQTWDHRVASLISHAESTTNDPRVSIIVVTYNNIELTRACLTSIDEQSHYTNIEIIVVDNASSDGSRDFLIEWAGTAVNRKLICNNDNRGFAAANNQGLEIATGDFLVLLNNDTHVTPGWVRTLVRHFLRDKSAGLIGPVTNNIGNEAKINISYSDMSDMITEAAAYTRRHIGKTFPVRTAAFFCVMMRRDTYTKVGPLDESFGRGFFEDDDYCRRIEQIGLSIVCVEDVFIHHELSASFDKLKQQERQALFLKNKKIYENKWGEWKAHSYQRHRKKTPPEPSTVNKFYGQNHIGGQCNVCGKLTRFYYQDVSLWRESLTCEHCLTTSRYRSLSRGILQALMELTGIKSQSLAALPHSNSRKLHVYDTQPPFYYNPCAYPLPDLLKSCGWIDVKLSQFKPNNPMGIQLKKGITNQNLECLTYDDASLDIVITSDVMEHVRLDDQAHREIYRVLRPGGIYIFTVPHDRSWDKTLVRVQVTNPANPTNDIYLLEPEYHGDTNSDDDCGVLAYRTYGRDIETTLAGLGFEVTYLREDIPAQGIINTELYYCRKKGPKDDIK